jgi:hypothetical protein
VPGYLAVLTLFVLVTSLASAGEKAPTGKPEEKNPLAKLPSKPGSHVEKIKAMPDNSWLNLGQAAADPKWGTARGRGYSPKMAYAADLRGAFFAGCGRHGYVKPNGHYMDDLWFYDANAHRWICLHPGASRKTRLKLNQHGFEVNEKGESHPVSYLSHAYNQLTYISSTRQFMAIYRYCPWWTKALPQRGAWLGIPKEKMGAYNAGKLNGSTRHPLFYNVTAGKWERRFIKGRAKGKRGKNLQPAGMGVLEYIPSRKQVAYLANGSVLFFDLVKNTWIDPKAPRARIKYDSTGCYDSKRDRIYVAKGGLWFYDLKANTWTQVKGKNQMKNLRSWPMTFDAVSGAIIIYSNAVHIYDPETNTWTQGAERPKANYKYKNSQGFYSPELNLHYYYMAGDSGNKGAFMLAYRHKRREKKTQAKAAK